MEELKINFTADQFRERDYRLDIKAINKQLGEILEMRSKDKFTAISIVTERAVEELKAKGFSVKPGTTKNMYIVSWEKEQA